MWLVSSPTSSHVPPHIAQVHRQDSATESSTGVSLWFGTELIALGVAVNLGSAWRHARLIRQLDRGEEGRCSPLAQDVAIALVLALVGLAMAVDLVSVRGSTHGQSGSTKGTSMSFGTPAGTNKGAPGGAENISSIETLAARAAG